MLRSLFIVEGAAVPPDVPPAPPPVVIMAMQWQVASLPVIESPADTQLSIRLLMGGCDCPDMYALDVQAAYMHLFTSHGGVPDPPHAVMWRALAYIADLSSVATCLLPLWRGALPQQLIDMGMRCFVNHPHISSSAHTHMDPTSLAMHEFYAAEDGVDAYFVHAPEHLLDILLPLALMHANRVVLALVPTSYVQSPYVHRRSLRRGPCPQDLVL